MKKIVVSGWFHFSHSITLVNLEQIKCLRNSNIDVYGIERAPLFPNWISTSNNYPIAQDKYYNNILQDYKPASSSIKYNAAIDIAVPPHSPPFLADKKCIFMVSETDVLSSTYIRFAGGMDRLLRLQDEVDFIFTPSSWSNCSLVNTGFDPNKILTIPHGVQKLEISLEARKLIRSQIRTQLKISEEKIMILHVGAMTENKGVDILIKSIVLSQYSNKICLVLKGNDSTFGSKRMVDKIINEFAGLGYKIPEIKYIGLNMSKNSMTQLYLSCDLYASLFRAEGFNLPVAEAANLNIPILTTKAPPVTEYLYDSKLCFFVDALQVINRSTKRIYQYEPQIESCIEQINKFCDTYQSSSIKLASHETKLLSWDQSARLISDGLGI